MGLDTENLLERLQKVATTAGQSNLSQLGRLRYVQGELADLCEEILDGTLVLVELEPDPAASKAMAEYASPKAPERPQDAPPAQDDQSPASGPADAPGRPQGPQKNARRA